MLFGVVKGTTEAIAAAGTEEAKAERIAHRAEASAEHAARDAEYEARQAAKEARREADTSCRMALDHAAPYGISVGMRISRDAPVLVFNATITNAFGTERKVRAGCVVEDGVITEVFIN